MRAVLCAVGGHGGAAEGKQHSLFALESRDPLCDFDFIGFTMQYEMSYTNVLNMLDLAGVPIFSKDRDDSHPVVVLGGPCTYNPEPLAEFADIFSRRGRGGAVRALRALCKSTKRRDLTARSSFTPSLPSFRAFTSPLFTT